MRVWLTRDVFVEGVGKGCFARAVELPFPPYPGLGLMVHGSLDPFNVEEVYINARGAIVVVLPSEEYDADSFTSGNFATEARSQFEWATRTWRKLGHPFESYQLAPPGEADLTPLTVPDKIG